MRKKHKIITIEDRGKSKLVRKGLLRLSALFVKELEIGEKHISEVHTILQLPSNVRIVGTNIDFDTGGMLVMIEGSCLPGINDGDKLPIYTPVYLGNYILWPFMRYKEI